LSEISRGRGDGNCEFSDENIMTLPFAKGLKCLDSLPGSFGFVSDIYKDMAYFF